MYFWVDYQKVVGRTYRKNKGKLFSVQYVLMNLNCIDCFIKRWLSLLYPFPWIECKLNRRNKRAIIQYADKVNGTDKKYGLGPGIETCNARYGSKPEINALGN